MKQGVRLLIILTFCSTFVSGCIIGTPGASESKVATCKVVQFTVPSFARRLLYDKNGLPAKLHYYKKISGDDIYAGTYIRAYRGANLDPKKAHLAPFEQSKQVKPVIYVDKSQTCRYVYVHIEHGMYNLAVYKRAK